MKCARGKFDAGSVRTAGTFVAIAFGAAAFGCSGDFGNRSTPPRGSLGRELYSMVCDRVGAQALREDVTGSSYHAICHADPLTGAYADKVDTTLLTPLDPNALDTDGHPVSIDQQRANRAYRVARIEALGRRREDLVRAFDTAIPDEKIAPKDLANPDPTKSCDAPASTANGEDALRKQLGATLGRMTDLYNDRTIPLLTESFAHVLDTVRLSPDVQQALTRLDARQGYRPSDVAIGVARPALSYPRIVDLANALLKLLATDSRPFDLAGAIDPSKPLGPDNRKPIPGKASGQFQQLLSVLHEEMRTTTAAAAPAPLTATPDAKDPTRVLLSRPRGTLELTRKVLFFDDDAFVGPSAKPRYLVQRDPRGVAALYPEGTVPAPFVDLTGPSGAPDGLPDLDPLGRFVVQGAPPASPFFSVDGFDGARDPSGLALNGGKRMYTYLDTSRTYLASLLRDAQPLFDPQKETIMGLAGGFPILFGSRDADASSTRTYPPDPSLADAWRLAHAEPPPANVGAMPVQLPYRAFHPEDSPLVDLVYALGQIIADPSFDDTLSLFRQLADQHPKELARLVGVALQIKKIADAHPEAHIPENSTFWDEILDVVAKMAHVEDTTNNGGILEDLIAAFGKDETLALRDAFTAYIDYRDEITYDPANLNGTAFDLTTGAVTPMMTPVDRSLPDSGSNRSALQRFMQLLHDANGLAACTKDGAVAHVDIVWQGIPVKLDYPTNILAKTVCAFLGSSAPSHINQCGILRFDNVAALLLDVALGRAKFDIRDDCLNKLVQNKTLTGLVGGPDAFLEQVSGIKGFSLHPTVNGVSRMVYYDTPHDGDPGDPSNPKTENFLKDVMDPVPSMVCAETPFHDPTDGKTVPLRQCSSFADTLRGRDANALFPLEQLDFIKNVQPLAAAFADHGQAMLFVQLFDTLHLHWGSPKQTKQECDPTLPRTDARWCAQDGAVTYEPILSEALKTDLFPTLRQLVPILQQMKVTHCQAQDPTTHACTQATQLDGVKVLADAVRALVDPARAQAVGLKDRRGNVTATRNDGTTNPQVTPLYLLIDALKGIDRAFTEDQAQPSGEPARLQRWRAARSQLVDTFFTIDGSGDASSWHDAAIPRILPELLDVVRAQVAAHCPDARITGACPWARAELANEVSDVVRGPTFAAVVDLIDAIRRDDGARTELEKLADYLLTSADEDAQTATVIAAHDVLQLLDDDANLTPLLHAVAEAVQPTLTNDQGKVVRRSVIDALLELLSRVLARAYDDQGHEICAREVDPTRSLATVLGKLVTPMAPDQPAPIEVLIDVITDVNRAHPDAPRLTKLVATDYANIANEVSDFCTNKERGLEQVYEVIREATHPE